MIVGDVYHHYITGFETFLSIFPIITLQTDHKKYSCCTEVIKHKRQSSLL